MRARFLALLAAPLFLVACETEQTHETSSIPVSKASGKSAAVPAAVPVSASPEDFLAAQTSYRARWTSSTAPRAFIDSAMRDLDARLRAIIGPVSFGSTPGEFNPSWLYRDGTEGAELDAIRFGALGSDRTILVTDEAILAAWVRAEGDTSSDPFVGLHNERVLTWVLGMNAHATIYTDIRRHGSVPPEVPLALLITHAQDVVGPHPPQEIVVGVRRGSRVFLIFAAAETLPSPAECVTNLDQAIKASGRFLDEEDEAFLKCYDRLAPEQREFTRVLEQVAELAALTRS